MQRTHADTGSGEHRRSLTLDEAREGLLPEPYTAEEWQDLHLSSRDARLHVAPSESVLPDTASLKRYCDQLHEAVAYELARRSAARR